MGLVRPLSNAESSGTWEAWQALSLQCGELAEGPAAPPCPASSKGQLEEQELFSEPGVKARAVRDRGGLQCPCWNGSS